jgi:hypothetical protein
MAEKRMQMSKTLERKYQEAEAVAAGLEVALAQVGEVRRAFWETARRECQAPKDSRLHLDHTTQEIVWEEE